MNLIKYVVESLEDMKIKNPKILYVKEQCTWTDYFIIAFGTSMRHLESTADYVAFALKKNHCSFIIDQGLMGWIAIDALDVVVHLFLPEVYEKYHLEDMWRL